MPPVDIAVRARSLGDRDQSSEEVQLRRLQAVITGRVQNVGFREFVRYAAAARNLTGYVRNSDDALRVEVVAEGDDDALAELLELLHKGPRFAHVHEVQSAYAESTSAFSRFSVER